MMPPPPPAATSTVDREDDVLDIPTFFTRLDELARDLKSNPRVIVEGWRVNPPATDDDIESAKSYLEEFKLQLPQDLEEFYRHANGFTLTYRHSAQPTTQAPCGGILIKPIGDVFRDHLDNVYFTSFEGGMEFRLVHPFDNFINEACYAFVLAPDAFPTLHYHYFGEKLKSLGMDLKTYLRCVLRTKGFWYWGAQRLADQPFGDTFDQRDILGDDIDSIQELVDSAISAGPQRQ